MPSSCRSQEAFLIVGTPGRTELFALLVLLQKADPAIAKEALEKAMMLDPTVKTKFPALRMLGQMIHGCGKHREAVDKWTQALELEKISNFQRVEAFFHRGTCRTKLTC